MIGGVNLNNFAVDENGRLSLSGSASGIDFQSAIDSIIAARRIPVDRLETQVAETGEKLDAYTEFKSLLNVLRDRLDALRGKVSFGGVGNVFEAKDVFASTSRADGTAPAAAASLVGVSVTNAADLGSHTVEVLQVATAQKVASAAATSTTVDLGTAFGGAANSISGSFEINGRRIEVQATDTLVDLAERINAANTGSSASQVTASIVSIDTFQHFLVLTADETGKSIEITDSTLESALVADNTAALSSYTGVVGAGHTFEIRDAADTLLGTVTYNDTDSLDTVAANISAVAGITASVVPVGAQFRLDIAADNGQSIKLTGDTSTLVADLALDADVLSDLGISADQGTTFLNELQIAQNAQFKADGLVDTAATQSSGRADAAAALGITGTLAIDTPNAGAVNIAVASGDSLNTIRDTINGNVTLQAAGISASVITDTAGQFHLEIRRTDLTVGDTGGVLDARPAASSDALNITDNLVFTRDDASTVDTIAVGAADSLDTIAANINGSAALQNAGVSASVVASGSGFRLQINYDTTLTVTSPDGADTALGLARPDLVIERDSNTVSDLFTGVTLTLFQAEVGTTIKLDIERDLAGVKQAVFDFVDAYNAVKVFANTQQLSDSNGSAATDTGPLFRDPTVGTIESLISNVLGTGAAGLASDSAFKVLTQIGINFVDNEAIEDPLLVDTLEIDEAALDDALLQNPEDVRRLLAFDFSTSDPRVSLISFTGQTQGATTSYTLDVTHDGTNVTAATINGVPGSVTIDGNKLTATDQTGANGLTILYTGTTSATGISLDISAGVSSQMFYDVDRILDPQTGLLETQVDTLTDQKDLAETRISEILERLDRQRQDLLDQFVRMEESLSRLNSILNAVRQQFDALSQSAG